MGGVLNFDIEQNSLELYKIFADIEEVKGELGMTSRLFFIENNSPLHIFLIFNF